MASFVLLMSEGPPPPSELTLAAAAAHRAVSVAAWSTLFERPAVSPGACCHTPALASLCGAASEVAQALPGGRQVLR